MILSGIPPNERLLRDLSTATACCHALLPFGLSTAMIRWFALTPGLPARHCRNPAAEFHPNASRSQDRYSKSANASRRFYQTSHLFRLYPAYGNGQQAQSSPVLRQPQRPTRFPAFAPLGVRGSLSVVSCPRHRSPTARPLAWRLAVPRRESRHSIAPKNAVSRKSRATQAPRVVGGNGRTSQSPQQTSLGCANHRIRIAPPEYCSIHARTRARPSSTRA